MMSRCADVNAAISIQKVKVKVKLKSTNRYQVAA